MKSSCDTPGCSIIILKQNIRTAQLCQASKQVSKRPDDIWQLSAKSSSMGALCVVDRAAAQSRWLNDSDRSALRTLSNLYIGGY